MPEKEPVDWQKYNKNFIGFRLPTDLTKDVLDEEAKKHNLKDRTTLIITALRQFLSPNSSPQQNSTTLDSLIRKMIPAFVEAGISLKLTKDEKKLVIEIYQEVSKNG